jgi:replicative DNA helicase
LGVYLKAHAGDDIRVDRQGRPSEYIAEPALTLGISPQPDVLKGLAERPGFRGRGLLARFLYALPESLLGRRDPRPAPVDEETRRQYAAHVTRLLDRFAPAAGGGDGPPPVRALTLDEGARDVLFTFTAELEPQLGPYGRLASIKDWGGKLAGAALRLAGLLHLAEHALDEHPWEYRISQETMANAVAIGRYLIPHAQAVHDLMGLDPGVAEARYVVGWITAKGPRSFSKRDAFEATKGRFKKVEELDPALCLLEERGYIRRRPWERGEGKRGRTPSPIYDVNPLLMAPAASSPTTAPPPHAQSQNAQNAQNGRAPERATAVAVPSQNGSGNSQNSAGPLWPDAAHQNGSIPPGAPAAVLIGAGASVAAGETDGEACEEGRP